MNTISLKKPIPIAKPHHSTITEFYNTTTDDYQFWSKNFNMHFGYFNGTFLNLFKRDVMLNQMNKQVIKRLQLPDKNATLIDLGCGMGATLKYALETHNNLTAFGVTLSDFQSYFGNQRLKELKGLLCQQNYNNTTFPSNSFNGAIAMESFCHSGHEIASFKEAYRLLKPNGKLVISDAFLKTPVTQLQGTGKWVYHQLCSHFKLPKLAPISEAKVSLKEVGFKKVKVEQMSMQIAPSVLHVPFAITSFVFKKILKGETLKKESLHNLLGSFYALLSGLHLHNFGYYVITATK